MDRPTGPAHEPCAPGGDLPDPGFAAWRDDQGERARGYLWRGDGARALSILEPLHRAHPEDREVQSMILDALALQGRSSDQFTWSEEPHLVSLGPELLDSLYELLASERRPATVLDLCLVVTEQGHPTFDADELLTALRRDGRFLVHTSNLAPECAVVLAKLHCL